MNNYVPEVLNACQYVLTATQVNQVWQIINAILSVICTVIIITLRIVSVVNEAKKDGKITQEEKQEIMNEIKEGAEDLKETISKTKED